MGDFRVKASVIIPMYNVERYISECLNSVLRQTLQDIEIICIDDGSKDRTPNIVQEFIKQDKRIKILKNKDNRGQAYARNRGIEIASGTYIYFMDADDKLTDVKAIQILYEHAERDELDCVVFNANVMNSEAISQDSETYNYYIKEYHGEILDGKEFLLRLFSYGKYQCTVWQQFWNAGFIRENKLFFMENFSPHEDYFFSFQAYISSTRIKCIDRYMYIHYQRETSSTKGNFTIRRLRAYLGCYIEIYKWLLSKEAGENAIPLFLWFIGMTEGNIKLGAMELLKNGIDVCAYPGLRSNEKIFLEKALSAGYVHLRQYWSLEEYREIAKARYVIVYGTGMVGEEVLRRLRRFGIANILCAETSKREKDATCLGFKVHSLQELTQHRDESIVLVSSVKKNQMEMIQHLRELGFEKYRVMV